MTDDLEPLFDASVDFSLGESQDKEQELIITFATPRKFTNSELTHIKGNIKVNALTPYYLSANTNADKKNTCSIHLKQSPTKTFNFMSSFHKDTNNTYNITVSLYKNLIEAVKKQLL
jgi:hypothetical protein